MKKRNNVKIIRDVDLKEKLISWKWKEKKNEEERDGKKKKKEKKNGNCNEYKNRKNNID